MDMPKLNQIIAVENGTKATHETRTTTAYKAVQNPAIFAGLIRVYEPLDDAGVGLPNENKNVVTTVGEQLTAFTDAATELYDITATKVYANTGAQADVVVDGEVILSGVPVEYLLFLEKRLDNVLTFVNKLPILDPSVSWTLDANTGLYASDEVIRNSTKKVLKNHVKAAATDKHAAQVDVYTEDEVVGHWKTIQTSGAVPLTTVVAWQKRILALQKAVKEAREEANMVEVAQVNTGKVIFDYLFATT